MASSFPIADGERERIEAVLSGRRAPVTPREAATVAIVRDGDDGLEVYLMRRVRQMAFAAGMHVFPGGSVDPADHIDPLGALDSAPVTAQQARVRAAVRETFEECDVSLAAGDLVPIAHWITPEIEPRRYDTHFFLAALPDGQECRDVGTEADQRIWVRPAQALEAGLRMMAPTAAVLADLARFDDVAGALAAVREIAPVQPVLTLAGDRLELQIPEPPTPPTP